MWKKLFLSSIGILFATALILPILNGNLPLNLGLDLAGGAMVTYRPDFNTVSERDADIPQAELLRIAKETLAGRVAQRFETLPDVLIRADGRLVVSLPGEHDQRKILETLGATYRLTFRRALAVHQQPPEQPAGMLSFYHGEWLELGPELLDGDMLDPRKIRVDHGASSTLESLGQGATVSFEFRPPYDELFAQVTRESLGKTLAILLDNEVEWAGRVESEIRGAGQLRGGYSLEEASEVAALLRSGNLPFSLRIESLTGVGPSLGQEMSSRGLQALVLSGGLLALLLLLAYGHRPALLLSGWASLGFLLFSTLGLIATFDLTVDLAAIAGLVLSIGMGMDAFILVFEALEGHRFDAARSPLGRIRQVYGWSGEGRTLLHANATTFLVVLLLFLPERLASFALFLVIGLLASLLTLLLTRSLLSFFARRGWLEDDSSAEPRKKRNPLSWLRGSRPGILRWRRAYFALLLVGLISAAAWLQIQRPGAWLNPGADFEPGMQLQISLAESQPIDGMIAALQESDPLLDVRYQTWQPPADSDDGIVGGTGTTGTETTGYLLHLEGQAWEQSTWQAGHSSDPEPLQSAAALSPTALVSWLAERDINLHGMYAVDARLSGQRILTSLSVLIGSFLLLACYLRYAQHYLDTKLAPSALRPSQGAGGRIFIGTVLAVALDIAVVLMTLALLEIPIGMPIVAALLTIVGYSVNDSMVLWSHLSRPASQALESADALQGRISEGVDRILSRTLLTSVSTMVPAVAILVTGLEPLHGFAWAVLVGTIAGTLSSIFVVASFAGPRSRARYFRRHRI